MTYPITGGVVQIDAADLAIAQSRQWHVSDTRYAVWRGMVSGVKKTVRMHRVIARCPADRIVDHINHDTLDNRRANLRVCTAFENQRNRRNQGKGYWFQRQNRNWVVEINGIHRGCFDTEAEAAEFAALVRAGKAYKKPRRLLDVERINDKGRTAA